MRVITWLIILFVIFLIFILSMFAHITLSLNMTQRDTENNTRIKVSLLGGLISFKIEVPKLALKEIQDKTAVEMVTHLETSDGAPIKEFTEKTNIQVILRKLRHLVDLMKDYWTIIKYLMKSTKIKRLLIKTEFGLGDPALTGILVGSIWSINGITLSLLSKYLTMEDNKPKIQVIPKFQQSTLYLDINCIFAIRIGHIIIATIRFLIKFLRQKGVK